MAACAIGNLNHVVVSFSNFTGLLAFTQSNSFYLGILPTSAMNSDIGYPDGYNSIFIPNNIGSVLKHQIHKKHQLLL